LTGTLRAGHEEEVVLSSVCSRCSTESGGASLFHFLRQSEAGPGQAALGSKKDQSLVLERRVEDMKKVLVVTVALTLILSAGAWAGLNPNAKAAVHVIPHASRSCTKSFPSIAGCENIITTEPTPDADAFPVFFDLVEYQGFDYGMTWPGMYSCVFTSCSDLTIGGIVNPGDGISHAWSACKPNTVGIPGWGWIYDYGMICLVPHPTQGGPNIGDCHAGEVDIPVCNFCAGIGGFIGDDPCLGPSAIEPSTWGGVKGMFR
jgi:hypothetical protein